MKTKHIQSAINTKVIYHINYTYKLNKNGSKQKSVPPTKNSNNAKIIVQIKKEGKIDARYN